MVAIPLLVRRQAGTTSTVTCSPKFVPSRNRTRGAAGGAGEGKGGCQRRRPRRAGTGTGHLWLAPPATESAHNQEFRQEAGIRSLIKTDSDLEPQAAGSLFLPALAVAPSPVPCQRRGTRRHWQWRWLAAAQSRCPRAGLDDAGGQRLGLGAHWHAASPPRRASLRPRRPKARTGGMPVPWRFGVRGLRVTHRGSAAVTQAGGEAASPYHRPSGASRVGWSDKPAGGLSANP